MSKLSTGLTITLRHPEDDDIMEAVGSLKAQGYNISAWMRNLIRCECGKKARIKKEGEGNV